MNSQYGPVLPQTHKELAKYMVGYIFVRGEPELTSDYIPEE